MEKIRRVLALAGVVILVLCYVMSMITAVMATPEAHNWFIASIGATFLIPAVLYAFHILIRVSGRNEEETRRREEAYLQQMKAQLKQSQGQAEAKCSENESESLVESVGNREGQ